MELGMSIQAERVGHLATWVNISCINLGQHMSPRWGLGGVGSRCCYKHVAPLGLKNGANPRTIHIALRPDKSGFKKTGAQALTASPFYRHIAPH